MITKRKLDKKLNVLLTRQNLLAKCIFCQFYKFEGVKEMEKSGTKSGMTLWRRNNA